MAERHPVKRFHPSNGRQKFPRGSRNFGGNDLRNELGHHPKANARPDIHQRLGDVGQPRERDKGGQEWRWNKVGAENREALEEGEMFDEDDEEMMQPNGQIKHGFDKKPPAHLRLGNAHSQKQRRDSFKGDGVEFADRPPEGFFRERMPKGRGGSEKSQDLRSEIVAKRQRQRMNDPGDLRSLLKQRRETFPPDAPEAFHVLPDEIYDDLARMPFNPDLPLTITMPNSASDLARSVTTHPHPRPFKLPVDWPDMDDDERGTPLSDDIYPPKKKPALKSSVANRLGPSTSVEKTLPRNVGRRGSDETARRPREEVRRVDRGSPKLKAGNGIKRARTKSPEVRRFKKRDVERDARYKEQVKERRELGGSSRRDIGSPRPVRRRISPPSQHRGSSKMVRPGGRVRPSSPLVKRKSVSPPVRRHARSPAMDLSRARARKNPVADYDEIDSESEEVDKNDESFVEDTYEELSSEDPDLDDSEMVNSDGSSEAEDESPEARQSPREMSEEPRRSLRDKSEEYRRGRREMAEKIRQGRREMVEDPRQGRREMVEEPRQGRREMIEEPQQGRRETVEEARQSRREMVEDPRQGRREMIEEPRQGRRRPPRPITPEDESDRAVDHYEMEMKAPENVPEKVPRHEKKKPTVSEMVPEPNMNFPNPLPALTGPGNPLLSNLNYQIAMNNLNQMTVNNALMNGLMGLAAQNFRMQQQPMMPPRPPMPMPPMVNLSNFQPQTGPILARPHSHPAIEKPKLSPRKFEQQPKITPPVSLKPPASNLTRISLKPASPENPSVESLTSDESRPESAKSEGQKISAFVPDDIPFPLPQHQQKPTAEGSSKFKFKEKRKENLGEVEIDGTMSKNGDIKWNLVPVNWTVSSYTAPGSVALEGIGREILADDPRVSAYCLRNQLPSLEVPIKQETN